MALTVGSASAGTGLAGEIKKDLAARRLIQTRDDGFVNDLCDACASAVIAHLKTNMQVDPLGTPIGPPNAVA